MDLGIPTALGEPDGLSFSASGRVEATLMHFDVAGIHIHRGSFLCTGMFFPESGPKSDAAPLAIVLIHSIPMSAGTINRTPRTAFAQNKKDAREDNLRRQRRTSSLRFRRSLEINVLWFLYAARASAPELPDLDVSSCRCEANFPLRFANA